MGPYDSDENAMRSAGFGLQHCLSRERTQWQLGKACPRGYTRAGVCTSRLPHFQNCDKKTCVPSATMVTSLEQTEYLYYSFPLHVSITNCTICTICTICAFCTI